MSEMHEFLSRNMEENWLLARQAEDRRATIAMVNLILASAAQGIFAFIGLNLKTLPLALWLIVLGIYGIAASMKLYERSQFHILRARKLRSRLDEFYPDAQVENLYRAAEKEQQMRYPVMMHVRLNNLWIGLHVLIAIAGIAYTVIDLKY